VLMLLNFRECSSFPAFNKQVVGGVKD